MVGFVKINTVVVDDLYVVTSSIINIKNNMVVYNMGEESLVAMLYDVTEYSYTHIYIYVSDLTFYGALILDKITKTHGWGYDMGVRDLEIYWLQLSFKKTKITFFCCKKL